RDWFRIHAARRPWCARRLARSTLAAGMRRGQRTGCCHADAAGLDSVRAFCLCYSVYSGEIAPTGVRHLFRVMFTERNGPLRKRCLTPSCRGLVMLSVIIPVLDEAEGLPQLVRELDQFADSQGQELQTIFVDDG